MRLLRRLTLSAAALLLLAAAAVYARSTSIRNATHEVNSPAFTLPLPSDSASLAEGERLAYTRGCFGCHAEGLRGQVFFEERFIGRVVAPNLTQVVPTYSDVDLERAIRRGVRPDGRALYSMASDMYRSLSDEDVARLMAWLRSIPPADGERQATALGPLGHLGIATGKFHHAVHYIRTEPVLPPPEDSALQLGHYIATTACTECHLQTFEGDGESSPSLPAIIPSYSLEEFTALMRDGVAKGDRELRMMSGVARGRFRHFTDAELAGLYAYLRSLPP